MPREIDMMGYRVGKLTVTRRARSASAGRSATWHCECDCGGSRALASWYLRRLAQDQREDLAQCLDCRAIAADARARERAAERALNKPLRCGRCRYRVTEAELVSVPSESGRGRPRRICRKCLRGKRSKSRRCPVCQDMPWRRRYPRCPGCKATPAPEQIPTAAEVADATIIDRWEGFDGGY